MSVFGKKKFKTIGGFPCAIYGSLLQREEEWFEAREFERIDKTIPVLEFANAIAKDQNISDEEAMKVVEGFADPKNLNPQLIQKYSKEIAALLDTVKFEKAFPVAIATLTIQSRVKSEFLEANCGDLFESFEIELPTLEETEKELSDLMQRDTALLPMSDAELARINELEQSLKFGGIWTAKETRGLPVGLIQELALFLLQERRSEPQESDEDKSLGESSIDSTKVDPPLQPTGKQSTPRSKKQA